MKLRVQVASTPAEVLRCQYLIAEVYNKEYEVVFSTDRYDLEAKIEPWPHRYFMVLDGAELAATLGLYQRQTYVERFGGVAREDIERELEAAGVKGGYDSSNLREVTKIVVSPAYRGRGLARLMVGCAHSRSFLSDGGDEQPLVVFCAKRSIAEKVHQAAGLRPRRVKPFPYYKVHELYRSADDPMDSYLIIPHLDVPARWYDLALPSDCDTNLMREEGA